MQQQRETRNLITCSELYSYIIAILLEEERGKRYFIRQFTNQKSISIKQSCNEHIIIRYIFNLYVTAYYVYLIHSPFPREKLFVDLIRLKKTVEEKEFV